ncbi:MAG: SRPBCC family protein [Geminicoccaceae bacterium]
MVQVRRSAVIDAPVDEVWSILRDFNGHDRWHPAVATSRIEGDEPSDSIGAVRDFRLADGSRLREQLLALSDRERSFTYCILEAPLPLLGYVAQVKLRPVTDGDRTFWEWRSRFDPPPAQRERLVRLVAEDIYEAGFRAIRDLLRTPVQQRAVATPVAAPAPLSGTVEADAVVVTRHGGPEGLELRKVRVPPPGPGEVRLRQTAIGVNFIDVYCRTGYFDLVTPPGILGMEAVGTVESVGPGVIGLRPGDRVGYACPPPGAYAACRVMDPALLIRLPDRLPDELAASLLLKGITASFLLHEVATVRPGDTVLVHAAAGGVGLLLCQWARQLGATVIGTVSTEAKAERARAAGCSEVVLSTGPEMVETVLRLTSGRGADIVYDAIGKASFESSVQALAPCGRLVSFGQASGDIGPYEIGRLAARSVTLSRPNYAHYTDTPEKLRRHTDRLFAALQSGAITPSPPTTYPLREAAAAHRDLESRRTMGALVLLP